jgi:uncharacterized protein (DUF3820 family)
LFSSIHPIQAGDSAVTFRWLENLINLEQGFCLSGISLYYHKLFSMHVSGSRPEKTCNLQSSPAERTHLPSFYLLYASNYLYESTVFHRGRLGRLLHHAITIKIRGNSYRLKDKLKTELIRTEEPAATS